MLAYQLLTHIHVFILRRLLKDSMVQNTTIYAALYDNIGAYMMAVLRRGLRRSHYFNTGAQNDS